jgi:hypothetical protein
MAAPLRFLVHLLPTSAAPTWMGWPLAAPVPATIVDAPRPATVPAAVSTGWYAWRLITPNNRELARSVFRFAAPDLCRRAVREMQSGAARIDISTVADPLTGQFSWRGELDGLPVAAGKRYEYEQGARYATRKFLDVVAGAEVTDVIRGLRDRRSPAPSRPALEGER